MVQAGWYVSGLKNSVQIHKADAKYFIVFGITWKLFTKLLILLRLRIFILKREACKASFKTNLGTEERTRFHMRLLLVTPRRLPAFFMGYAFIF